MELNIQYIADAKIQEMHDSGKISSAIESGIESLIMKSVESALNGYDLRRDIEKQISSSISEVAKDIGFSAYNGFIAQKVKDITENVMREDVSQKIQEVFNGLLIDKHDGIKLSEIIEAYRKDLFENVDESEKWERHTFTCDVDEKRDGSFTWYTIKLHEEELSRHDDPEIMFKILVLGEKSSDKICQLYLDGKSQDGVFILGRLSKMQTLLCNLYFNGTPIILDMENVDDSNHYDIDD